MRATSSPIHSSAISEKGWIGVAQVATPGVLAMSKGSDLHRQVLDEAEQPSEIVCFG